MSSYNNYLDTIKKFYKDFSIDKLNEISGERIIELNLFSQFLNQEYNRKDKEEIKAAQYIKTRERINGTNGLTPAEKHVLFMFSVDPNFEIFIINGVCNKIDESKTIIKNQFGFYNIELLKTEKNYIKNFIGFKRKNEINNEIYERVYK